MQYKIIPYLINCLEYYTTRDCKIQFKNIFNVNTQKI
jgi:hypothetical protein